MFINYNLGGMYMKKAYEKPSATWMELRPEEKMAVCEWPIGFTTTGGVGCSQTWSEVSAYSPMCLSLYNNSQTSGS